MRALIHLLSIELYGQPLPLPSFPKNKDIRGFGLSDDLCYAIPLARKFDYTNTYYDREPYLDLTAFHPEQYGTYDFILPSDVFEHVAPPVERAFDEACRLLKPDGVLCITVPSTPDEVPTVEHFPELHKYGVANLDGELILVNRKKDGALELHENLEFHGGIGATLVMRLFSQMDLAHKLRASGFSEVPYLTESSEAAGIFLVERWSLPLVARKQRHQLLSTALGPADAEQPEEVIVPPPPQPSIQELEDRIAQLSREKWELHDRATTSEEQVRLAAGSRWLRFGNILGLGPRLR